jgi:hypothetical protein
MEVPLFGGNVMEREADVARTETKNIFRFDTEQGLWS